MTEANIQAAIDAATKGANIVLEWERDCAVLKRGELNGRNVRKHVRAVGRMGVEYDNQKAVQEKRASGELPKENAGLADWQEWEQYPFILRHKVNGTRYLRLYNGTSKTTTPKRYFTVDGELKEFSAIESALAASERKEHDGDCFMVKIESLLRVHTEMA